MALITKSDFSEFVDFTDNIESRRLDFHIKDAQDMDFKPRVPDAFYIAVQVVTSPLNDMDSFRINFVRGLMVCFAYQRYLLWAGRQNTQYGLVQIREDTSEQISDKARGELINDIKSKTNVYLSKFFNELKTKVYTFDGVIYDFGSTSCGSSTKPSIKIRAV